MYIVEYKIKNKFNIYKYLEKCFFVSFLIRNEIIKYTKKQFKKLKNDKDYNLLLKERKELKSKNKSLTKINQSRTRLFQRKVNHLIEILVKSNKLL